MNQDSNKIGRRIRQIREMAGVKRRTLAALVGVDTTYLCRIETGAIKAPGAALILKLSSALGVTPNDLMLEPNPQPQEKASA